MTVDRSPSLAGNVIMPGLIPNPDTIQDRFGKDLIENLSSIGSSSRRAASQGFTKDAEKESAILRCTLTPRAAPDFSVGCRWGLALGGKVCDGEAATEF